MVDYNTANYKEQGGDKWVVDGELDVTGTMKKDSTEITANADELNELDKSEVGGIRKLKFINMTASDFGDGSEVDTGWSLPDKAIVKNVYLDVNTKEDTATTKTIDVGTDGSGSDDPDGFLVGVSVATAGLVKGTVVDGGVTLGALLLTDLDGTSDVREDDITSGGDNITVTPAEAFSEADFDVIVDYIEIA